MRNQNGQQETRSVLGRMYDHYRATYPTTLESIRHTAERMFRELHGQALEQPEQVAMVIMGMLEEETRFAYEDAIRVGVQLALALELDCRD